MAKNNDKRATFQFKTGNLYEWLKWQQLAVGSETAKGNWYLNAETREVFVVDHKVSQPELVHLMTVK